MPPPGHHKAVRARIVELLSGTDHAVFAAENGASPDNAALLGVALDVLEEAAAMAGGGHKAGAPALVKVDFRCEPSMYRPLSALAHILHMKTSDLLRSLLHAVMQTPREPSPRPNRSWKPLVGCEAVRARLTMASTRDGTTLMHFRFKVSSGLYRALCARAAAHGSVLNRYVKLWMADLIDGRLSELQLVPVPVTQLFADERSYVLPAPFACAADALDSVP
jgi:hypothetical protein